MNENENTVNTTPTEERAFTQDDVNRIVGERLSKERQKIEAEFSKRDQEFKQREYMLFAKETLERKAIRLNWPIT